MYFNPFRTLVPDMKPIIYQEVRGRYFLGCAENLRLGVIAHTLNELVTSEKKTQIIGSTL